MPRSIVRRSTRTPLWFAALHLGLAGPVRLLGDCRPLCRKGECSPCLARFAGIHGAVGVVEIDDDVGGIEQHDQMLREIGQGIDPDVPVAE